MWELYHEEDWVLKNWCFQIVVLGKILEISLSSKEMKPVNPKGINPEYSLEGLMLKLQSFGHLMQRADSLERTLMLGKTEGQRRRRRQRIRWLDGLTDSTDMRFEQTQGYSEGQGSLACCGSWGHRESDRTEQRNNRLPIFGYKIVFLTCRSASMLSLLNHSWGNSSAKQ